MADQLAEELRQALPATGVGRETAAGTLAVVAALPAPADPQRVAAALGGRANVRRVEHAGSRVRIEIAENARLDRAALSHLSVRAVAYPQPCVIHLIVGPAAAAMTEALQQALEHPSS
jgi:PTS system N-acetylglucosamine-specific IIC component